MRFRIKNQEGSSINFRIKTRDDDCFNFSVNEKFKGNTSVLITSRIERSELEEIIYRIKLFLFDVDNPRNGDVPAEERAKIIEARSKLKI